MQPVLNNVILQLEKKYLDTVTFESGVKLHVDTSWHPEEYSMLQGKVVGVPKGIIKRHDYSGMAINMIPGDELLVRYDLVFSYKDQPDRDSVVYKNLVCWLGEEKLTEYWFCDIQKVFAIIRNGVAIMQNGYVMIELDKGTLPATSLVLPESCLTKVSNTQATIMHIGEPLQGRPKLDLKPNDRIRFTPGVAQRYEMDTKKFAIIKQSHILAKL